MGEHTYNIEGQSVYFSESANIGCLCTFPHNDELENNPLNKERVKNLALLGMAVIRLFELRKIENEYFYIPSGLPELWVKRLNEYFGEKNP